MQRTLQFAFAAILGAAAWAAITHSHSSVAWAESEYSISAPTAKFIGPIHMT
jgi:hypothetical protein